MHMFKVYSLMGSTKILIFLKKELARRGKHMIEKWREKKKLKSL